MKYRDGIQPREVIVKCGADMIMPFSIIFGFYIIMFGTISPGGGFQGGVIVSAAAVLAYMGYGHKTATQAINMEVLRVNEAIAAIIYTMLGFCGLFFGIMFCQNVFADVGNIGDMISAGTITFMSVTVGYKVLTGVSFLLLLLLGMLGFDASAREKE